MSTMTHYNRHGRPLQGIGIRSNTDYAVTAVVGIFLLHFLIIPALVLWAIMMAGCALIGSLPALILISLTHGAVQYHTLVLVILIAGGTLGVLQGCRLTWLFVRGFVNKTRFRSINGYRGPLGRW